MYHISCNVINDKTVILCSVKFQCTDVICILNILITDATRFAIIAQKCQ